MSTSNIKNLIRSLVRESISETSIAYPTVTLQVSTLSGTVIFLYKGDVKDRDDVVNNVHFKSARKFNTILSVVRKLKSSESRGDKISLDKFRSDDRDVISILLNLTDEELNELEIEKIIVTNNIPNEILDLTGKNIPVD